MASSPFVLNQADVPWESRIHGDVHVDERHVSARQPAQKLSYGITSVPPGKKSFPLHFHHDNDELFLILEGEGRLRYGAGEERVRPGDVISCPPGPESAHQFINDGTVPLVYLVVASMHAPDVAEYPDSGKVNVMVGTAAGGDKTRRPFSGIYRKQQTADYWEGEG